MFHLPPEKPKIPIVGKKLLALCTPSGPWKIQIDGVTTVFQIILFNDPVETAIRVYNLEPLTSYHHHHQVLTIINHFSVSLNKHI